MFGVSFLCHTPCVDKLNLGNIVYCRPDDEGPDIPWDELEADPDHFYDTRVFDFGVTLAHPSKLSGAEVHSLATTLMVISGTSSPTPFVFRETSEPSTAERSRSPPIRGHTPTSDRGSRASTPIPARRRSESILPRSPTPRREGTKFKSCFNLSMLTYKL
jgi:hypothetical protein